MINQPKYKICRRLGAGVYEKCQTQKFVISEAKKGAGKKGGKRPKAPSEYGLRLLEKQKIRFSYGVSERQFSNYVKDAVSAKGASAALKLYSSLESRLDNLVYRMGLAHTRTLARQIVAHGHMTVNGQRVTVPSAQIRVGDIIKIREGSLNKVLFADLAKKLKDYSAPSYVSYDVEKNEGKLLDTPKAPETVYDWGAVLEFYTK